jgi:hypothetical protein
MYPRLLRAVSLAAALAGASFFGWPISGAAEGGPTFSGQATVASATVPGVVGPITVSDTGLQQGAKFAEDRSLLTVSQPLGSAGQLNGEVAHATTVAQGNASRSEASLAGVNLTLLGQTLNADFLMSRAAAECRSGGPVLSGDSQLAALVVDGNPVTVSGFPNQTIELPGNAGQVIINEQKTSRDSSNNSGTIDVNALHVIITNPLSGATLADVVIAHAHADATCPAAAPPPQSCGTTPTDFVTGGGWIPSPADPKSKANFAVAGGIKNGLFWGHLQYIDHGNPNGYRVKGTGVTGYNFYPDLGKNGRQVLGSAEVNGAGNHRYEADVADNGEPGAGSATTPPDRFQLKIDGVMIASSALSGGNIQLHNACV